MRPLSQPRPNTFESMKPDAPGRKLSQSVVSRNAFSGWLAMLAVVGVVLIRTINLGADAPKGLPAEADCGMYVDEGFKTLWPRNMVVFGTGHWHPRDDYPGW